MRTLFPRGAPLEPRPPRGGPSRRRTRASPGDPCDLSAQSRKPPTGSRRGSTARRFGCCRRVLAPRSKWRRDSAQAARAEGGLATSPGSRPTCSPCSTGAGCWAGCSARPRPAWTGRRCFGGPSPSMSFSARSARGGCGSSPSSPSGSPSPGSWRTSACRPRPRRSRGPVTRAKRWATTRALSFRKLLESAEVPKGRAVTAKDFRGFFERHRAACRFTGAHMLFEELRGVLAASSPTPRAPPQGAAQRPAHAVREIQV